MERCFLRLAYVNNNPYIISLLKNKGRIHVNYHYNRKYEPFQIDQTAIIKMDKMCRI